MNISNVNFQAFFGLKSLRANETLELSFFFLNVFVVSFNTTFGLKILRTNETMEGSLIFLNISDVTFKMSFGFKSFKRTNVALKSPFIFMNEFYMTINCLSILK